MLEAPSSQMGLAITVSCDALGRSSVPALPTCASTPLPSTGEWPSMAFDGDVVPLAFRDLFPNSGFFLIAEWALLNKSKLFCYIVVL